MSAEAHRVRVATYNIHGGIGQDGREDIGRTAAVIGALGADVVGLQEVHSRPGPGGTVDFLARTSGYEAIPGPTLERERRSYGNVLLTRHPVRAIRRLDLSVPGYEPRGAIDAELNVHGATVRVGVTHLGLRRAERRSQLKRLLSLLPSERSGTEILLGDFNEWWPLAMSLRRLRAHYGRPPAPRSFPAKRPLLALDRIWVFPATHLLSLKAHDTPLSRMASDHLPVCAVVRLAGLSRRPACRGC